MVVQLTTGKIQKKYTQNTFVFSCILPNLSSHNKNTRKHWLVYFIRQSKIYSYFIGILFKHKLYFQFRGIVQKYPPCIFEVAGINTRAPPLYFPGTLKIPGAYLQYIMPFWKFRERRRCRRCPKYAKFYIILKLHSLRDELNNSNYQGICTIKRQFWYAYYNS